MGSRDDDRSQLEWDKLKKGLNTKSFFIGVLSATVIASGLWWGLDSRPMHTKNRQLRKEVVSKSEQIEKISLQNKELDNRIAFADSTIKSNNKKIATYASSNYNLKKELTQIKAEYDNTRQYLEGVNVALSDTLRWAREQASYNTTKMNSLEAKLEERVTQVGVLSDSTKNLNNEIIDYKNTISNQELKIQDLIPPKLGITNRTTIYVFGQASENRSVQGYGLGIGTRIFGSETASLRARVDFTPNIDQDVTYKNFGPDLRFGDKNGRYNVEIGTGLNIARDNGAKNSYRSYFGGGLDVDFGWIEGLGVFGYARGIKGELPSLQFGTRFGKK